MFSFFVEGSRSNISNRYRHCRNVNVECLLYLKKLESNKRYHGSSSSSNNNFWDRSKKTVNSTKSKIEQSLEGANEVFQSANRKHKETVKKVSQLGKNTIDKRQKVSTNQ